MNKRKIRLWHVALVFLAILLIGFGAFWIGARNALRHRIAAIRAKGEPVTLVGLDAWYAKPLSGENAADYIVEAFARLHIPEGEEREQIPLFGNIELPAGTQPLDNETQMLVDKLLAENAEALELLHQSASIEQCRYPVDLSRGQNTLLPHVSEISKAARLLALEAASRTSHGQTNDAVRSVVCAYGLGRSLLHEPVPISQTVRYVCDNIATDTLERLLNGPALTDDLLVELEWTLQTASDPNALARALVGERCLNHEVFSNPRSMGFSTMGGSDEPSVASIELRRIAGILDREWSVFLDLMGEYIDAARLPVHKRLAVSREINARLAALPSSYTLIRFVMPSIGRLISVDLTDLARIEIARTALAVERYRLAKGQLPSELADLVPTYLDRLPLDPFDGRPIRYKALEKGYLLYSIGRDEMDDGGQKRLSGRAGREQTQYDIVFTVER